VWYIPGHATNPQRGKYLTVQGLKNRTI